MMPHEPLQDIMRRTMANLKFVEANAGEDGPFEVTQLINSFLGALAHPWEALRDDLNQMSLEAANAAGWPKLGKERGTDSDPRSLGDMVRLMRNSIAHGNIEFLPGPRGEIRALRIWNLHPSSGKRTWGVLVTVADMRLFLQCFVELTEELHETQQRPRTA